LGKGGEVSRVGVKMKISMTIEQLCKLKPEFEQYVQTGVKKFFGNDDDEVLPDEEVTEDGLPSDAFERYEVLDKDFNKYLPSNVCTGRSKRRMYQQCLVDAMDDENCITIRGWVLAVNPKGGASVYALVRRIIEAAPKAFKQIEG
jgi:hypothetical protein